MVDADWKDQKKDNNQYGPERLVVVHGRCGFAALAFVASVFIALGGGAMVVFALAKWLRVASTSRAPATSRASAVRAALRAASSEHLEEALAQELDAAQMTRVPLNWPSYIPARTTAALWPNAKTRRRAWMRSQHLTRS